MGGRKRFTHDCEQLELDVMTKGKTYGCGCPEHLSTCLLAILPIAQLSVTIRCCLPPIWATRASFGTTAQYRWRDSNTTRRDPSRLPERRWCSPHIAEIRHDRYRPSAHLQMCRCGHSLPPSHLSHKDPQKRGRDRSLTDAADKNESVSSLFSPSIFPRASLH
jgi:hypothetical protein